MSEKPETDDFDDQDVDELAGDSEDQDLERATKDLELSRKRGPKTVGDPAWRRLEEIQEKKRIQALISDFDDYDIGLDDKPDRGKSRS
jgi:hypothetical protein